MIGQSWECKQCTHNMFRILLLFNIFQHARSVNIVLTQLSVQAVGCHSLKVTFRVGNEIEWLTGDFKACGGGKCKSVSVGRFDNDKNKMVTIPINLSPCKSYSFQVTSKLSGGKHDKKTITSWQAKVFGNCCPELTSNAPTTTTTTTTLTTTTLEGEDPTSASSGKSTTLFSDSQTNTATIGIVVSVMLIALIAIALVMILIKKKGQENKKRGEVIKTEENNLYGIYGDGPLYNVVTDENDYYGS